LIRQIISGLHVATSGDVDQIVERVATAPFNPEIIPVPGSMRGLDYLDDVLSRREPSILTHLVKRVLVEYQWSSGTTIDDYLGDLRRGVRQDAARLALFSRRAGSMVVSLATTNVIVPEQRRGARWQPVFVVAFSADRGIIDSGYQASGLDKVAIPGDARWLK
jgi:hypothetical protein